MEITELKEFFNNNGKRDLNKKDPHWKILFELYRKNTGNKLIIGCGSCFVKAWRWLEKQ